MPFVDGVWVEEAEAGGGGGETKTRTVTVNGRLLLIDALTGETIRDLGVAGTPKVETPPAAKPDRNLGAGVFEDASGYYVFDRTQTGSGADDDPYGTDQRKRYITEGEAKQITSRPSGGAGGADSVSLGNLSARYAELQLAQQELDQRIQNDALNYQLSLKKQNLYEDQALFERAIGNQQIALQKSGLALQEAGMVQDYESSIATRMQQREIINVQMQQATAQFNAQMGFQVAQANVAAQQRKQEQVQSLGRDIASYSADPGDRAALASYVLANTGYGRAAQTEGLDLRTDESLTPLEMALGTREDVMASPDRPFSFSPMGTPQLPELQLPQRPPPVITPTTLTPSLASGGDEFDAWAAGAGGGRAIEGGGVEIKNAGGANIAFSQSVLDMMKADPKLASGFGFPQMAEGGTVKGAFVAGDSKDGKENKEIIIPDFPAPGMTTVVPEGKLTPKMKAHMGKMQKMQTGGVFQSGAFEGLGSDRTRARTFLEEVERRARAGTPWATGALPDLTFESTPGFDPFVSSLLQGLRSSAQGLPVAWQQRQQALLTPPGIREGVIGRSR